MNKKALFIMISGIAGHLALIHADTSMANQIGVGTRAASFANNYVAAANDMSSVYWNPAALAFLPVREAQASFDMLSNTSTTDYYNTTQTSTLRRLQLSSIGYLSAVPATRGGLTFAFAFQSPVVFERNPSFNGSEPKTSIRREDTYRGFGDLRFWSGAFGIQVAPGLGIGVAPSLVTGRETIKEKLLKTTSGTVPFEELYTADRRYFGYDLRAGFLYSPPGKSLRIGGRLVFPQTIWFNENSTFRSSAESLNTFSLSGVLTSSFSGALGAAEVLPFGTISTEVRFRAPYDYLYPEDNIPKSSPAGYFKNGGGIGAEIPVLKSNVLVRFGYSLDEFDLYQFAMKYDNEPVGSDLMDSTITWGTDGITVNKDRQELTFGLAYVTTGISIEASYEYRFWNLTTNGHRRENEHLQRILVSMSTRF